MTQPHPDPTAVPPEGYDGPAAPPAYPGQQHAAGPQTQQPYQGQQQGYPAGPQQPSPGQPQYQDSAPAPQQYQSQPPMPNPAYGQPPAPQQYQPQPPMPNPAYGQPQAPQQYQSQPPMPNPAYGYSQPKSKIVAGLLGIFLGPLGIHRFYLGFTKIAVIQLVLTLVLGAFGLGVVGLWGVIEGIMILAGSSQFRADARGVRLRD